MRDGQEAVSQIVVTAGEMRDVEGRMLAAGMPGSALMEKVGGLIAVRVGVVAKGCCVGVLVGPGDNGGVALVVARELHWRGYEVRLFCPFSELKVLTGEFLRYAQGLGIGCCEEVGGLLGCDFLIDGLFGLGLDGLVADGVAGAIDVLNGWGKPILSVDVPSGLQADTGEVLGTAIRATRTFCLGLWKLAFFQDEALEYVGVAELIDFDIPWAVVRAVVGDVPRVKCITGGMALSSLPLNRSVATHKYKEGHLLLVCGSRRYGGGSILTALGARASGVGMLSVAVPESLRSVVVSHLPEALVFGCPETASGAMAGLQLPAGMDLGCFDAIACGPGLSLDAVSVVEEVFSSDGCLVLDADGLNILAGLGWVSRLQERGAPTILTPHGGEFRRLFPYVVDFNEDRIKAVVRAARDCGAVVLLKGARSVMANCEGRVWVNGESSAGLARGGSGDVLTGLVGGLLAQGIIRGFGVEDVVASGVWWHSQAGILAAQERTVLGVDAFTLTQYLGKFISGQSFITGFVDK
ncbi:NAD(P)H-hydrate dehydratase [Umezakia ovalisporum]|jgi:NAD(P)H-hydrate epimerase|uniref:NAD(P)H-hydrate dehydratase n=1 Tax=Umezakia ovalisporum TaxID=75695 RepID=UPI0024745D0C|nr:NAD(P)H-hydrate dehydratase [Umezakia ovalisporum]MDH6088867.1 NAD(P)H-hydrate dehydratase [Umezakia ovalisporum Ak1311]